MQSWWLHILRIDNGYLKSTEGSQIADRQREQLRRLQLLGVETDVLEARLPVDRRRRGRPA